MTVGLVFWGVFLRCEVVVCVLAELKRPRDNCSVSRRGVWFLSERIIIFVDFVLELNNA